MSFDLFMYILGTLFFVLAGLNIQFRGLRFEWFGFAAFGATLIF